MLLNCRNAVLRGPLEVVSWTEFEGTRRPSPRARFRARPPAAAVEPQGSQRARGSGISGIPCRCFIHMDDAISTPRSICRASSCWQVLALGKVRGQGGGQAQVHLQGPVPGDRLVRDFRRNGG